MIQAALAAGVEVIVRSGRTLWDSDEIVRANGGKPTMSTTQLQNAGKKLGRIAKPLLAPNSLPDPGEMPVDFEGDSPDAKPDFNADQRSGNDTGYMSISGPRGDFAIETMEELGFPAATTPHKGGESIALERLEKLMQNKNYVAKFRKPETSPAQFEPQSTTLLSPFFHFGALSVRLLYWRVQEVLDTCGSGFSMPPESLHGQILFRDMYFAAQAALGEGFAQMAMNPYCRFIPWHLPSKRDPTTGMITGDYHTDDTVAETWFRRWKFGMTGFPWIDALMRQLRQEGWIHHLGRHSVACFLTRGGCYIDWERGAEVFEEWLIDHEPACNIGNWQWLACVAFFHQYHRCYSPIAFGQKWDKNGDFIRRYVPELARLDAKFIYEPWKAPIVDQKKAGVRVLAMTKASEEALGSISSSSSNGSSGGEGATYPKPMFDFGKRRDLCMAAMKNAYSVGLYGDNVKVLNGSWRTVFPPAGQVEIMGEYEEDVKMEEEDEDEERKVGIVDESMVAGEKRRVDGGSVEVVVKKQKPTV